MFILTQKLRIDWIKLFFLFGSGLWMPIATVSVCAIHNNNNKHYSPLFVSFSMWCIFVVIIITEQQLIFSMLKAERDSGEEKKVRIARIMDVCNMQVLHKSRWCEKGWMVNGSFIKGNRSANQGFFNFFSSPSRISISSKLEITVFVPHSTHGSIYFEGWAK